MNRALWFDRLHDIAPRIGDPLLHMLSSVLASPARRDALLHLADGLDEAAGQEHFASHVARAVDCRRLAEAIRAEAVTRPVEDRVL